MLFYYWLFYSKGGGWRLLGVQLLACVATAAWGVVTTVILLYGIEKTIGIRLTAEEERLGCDLVEHGIGEDSEDEEIETGVRQSNKKPSFAKSASTLVERFGSEEVDETKERKLAGAFVMKLPTLARNLRRKNQNQQSTNQEGEAEAEVEENRKVVDNNSGSYSKGAFLMKLSIIARNLRRKHDNRQSSKREENDANIGDVASEKEEDPQTSQNESTNQACTSGSVKTLNSDGDGKGSHDLRSIYSLESEIEDLIKQEMKSPSETSYPMSVVKRAEDKCLQVICKDGVLIEI